MPRNFTNALLLVLAGITGAVAIMLTWGYFTERTAAGLASLLFFWALFAVAMGLNFLARKRTKL